MTPEKTTLFPAQMTQLACCEICEAVLDADSTRRLNGFVICGGCAEKHSHEIQAEARRRNHTRFCELKLRGLVDDGFLDINFSRSDRGVEALNPEAWRLARAWSGQNIFACGPVGTGKTYIARCILFKAFQNKRDVGIVCARRFAKLSDRFDEGGGLMRQWCRVPVLLLDDLDKAAWTPDRLGALWELLDRRMNSKSVTLVTSNCPSKELRELLRVACENNKSMADAALDRLKPCVTLELTGKSLR